MAFLGLHPPLIAAPPRASLTKYAGFFTSNGSVVLPTYQEPSMGLRGRKLEKNGCNSQAAPGRYDQRIPQNRLKFNAIRSVADLIRT